MSLIKSGKAQPQQQLTVFEQLQLLKQAKLARQPPCPFWAHLENSQKDWGDAKVGRRAVRVVHRRDTTRVCVVIAADHHAEVSDNK